MHLVRSLNHDVTQQMNRQRVEQPSSPQGLNPSIPSILLLFLHTYLVGVQLEVRAVELLCDDLRHVLPRLIIIQTTALISLVHLVYCGAEGGRRRVGHTTCAFANTSTTLSGLQQMASPLKHPYYHPKQPSLTQAEPPTPTPTLHHWLGCPCPALPAKKSLLHSLLTSAGLIALRRDSTAASSAVLSLV